MTAKVELLTPSGGKVILDPTNTAVDRVLTLPALAGTVLNTASDIEAQVKTATSATGSAPIYACRAWVNFNGEGTVAIRASGNVSSITDNGTGDYTVNFATAMPDGNYSTIISGEHHEAVVLGFAGYIEAGTATSVTVNSINVNGTRFDNDLFNVAIFR